DGEVAAAEVLHEGGPAVLGTGAGTLIAVVAGSGDAAVDVTGEDHLDMAGVIVLRDDAGAALFELAGKARGGALDGEVEIAGGRAAGEVANGAADQIDVGDGFGGELLHAQNNGALLGGEAGFEEI